LRFQKSEQTITTTLKNLFSSQMSIVIQNLTKVYGSQRALNGISFTAEKGRIMGFLGPNGAGKSTTMKITTGCITASEGTVLIDNVDVSKNPMKVKMNTGYLPEHNPLYLDMYVKEYLTFIGSVYKLKQVRTKVEEIIELVGLDEEKEKKIHMLSKGYRQRVGLAQALIHDPKVLILDEPTSGLDPNQLVEIRKVIKNVSKDKTVIFSTHVMQEVEVLCDDIVIINKGEIVANDMVSNLKARQSNSINYRLEFEEEIDPSVFGKLSIVKSKGNVYLIESKEKDTRKVIMKIVGDHSLPLMSITKEEQSLEGVFQELTKV